MDSATALRLSDLNLAEFNRESARGTRGGIVHEEGGLLCFIPSHRLPVGSVGAMRIDPRLAATDAVRRARDFFAGHHTGFTMWAGTHGDQDLVAVLEADGLSPFGGRAAPGMVLDAPLPEVPLPAGTRLVRAADAKAVEDFAHVNGLAYATYGMPAGVAEAQFAWTDFWLAPHVVLFVAYADDAPSAAAMTYVSHGVSGVYWVGTTPAARGRGLADAVVRHATNAGLAMGARIASLQASVMGEPIYRRQGYREITRYPWFVVMP